MQHTTMRASHPRVVEGQAHGGGGAFAFFAENLQLAAVTFGVLFGDRQPQPGALDRTDVGGPVEWLEQVPQVVLWNANPLVGDLENHFIGLTRHIKAYGAAAVGVFDGVGEQVGQDVPHH
jgi:hypothetical protein